jgi:DNA (cytosine-5)-methyltransferase 1
MVDGQPMALDIRFRMLQPHELAAAMGFPDGYAFAGNRGEQVRQIGNAVAVNLARALCRSLLGAAA